MYKTQKKLHLHDQMSGWLRYIDYISKAHEHTCKNMFVCLDLCEVVISVENWTTKGRTARIDLLFILVEMIKGAVDDTWRGDGNDWERDKPQSTDIFYLWKWITRNNEI